MKHSSTLFEIKRDTNHTALREERRRLVHFAILLLTNKERNKQPKNGEIVRNLKKMFNDNKVNKIDNIDNIAKIAKSQYCRATGLELP